MITRCNGVRTAMVERFLGSVLVKNSVVAPCNLTCDKRGYRVELGDTARGQVSTEPVLIFVSIDVVNQIYSG
jgi:hypothetical protein